MRPFLRQSYRVRENYNIAQSGVLVKLLEDCYGPELWKVNMKRGLSGHWTRGLILRFYPYPERDTANKS